MTKKYPQIEAVTFKTAYPLKRESYVLTDFGEPLTEQCHTEACDINNIMARPDLEQLLEAPEQTFGDFSDVLEYHEVMNKLTASVASFSKLPAHIRERFENDHMQMIAFMSDPTNEAEAIELGLLLTPDEPEPKIPEPAPKKVDDDDKSPKLP